MKVLNAWSTHVSPPLQGPITKIIDLVWKYTTDLGANVPSPGSTTSMDSNVHTDTAGITTTPSLSIPPASASLTISAIQTPNAALSLKNPLTHFTIKPRNHTKTKAWKYLRWYIWYGAVSFVLCVLIYVYIGVRKLMERRRTERVWVGMELRDLRGQERSVEME
jgi:hypothetical protein